MVWRCKGERIPVEAATAPMRMGGTARMKQAAAETKHVIWALATLPVPRILW